MNVIEDMFSTKIIYSTVTPQITKLCYTPAQKYFNAEKLKKHSIRGRFSILELEAYIFVSRRPH